MKNFLYNIRRSLRDLVHGRTLPELPRSPIPKKIITVSIQTQKLTPPKLIESNIGDAVEITKKSVESQSGETVVVLPYDDAAILTHLTKSHRSLVFKYILKRLNKAIHNQWPVVAVFKFGTTAKVAQIGYAAYELQLNGMMKWFIETEDYESAGVCRDLLCHLKTFDVVN